MSGILPDPLAQGTTVVSSSLTLPQNPTAKDVISEAATVITM